MNHEEKSVNMTSSVGTEPDRDPASTKAKTPEEYPRVLIVYLSCINKADQHNMSLRNWFAEWPRDRLAQIYSGNEQGEERFCGHTFKLGPQERRWGRIFFRLRNTELLRAGQPVIPESGTGAPVQRFGIRDVVRYRVGKLLVNSGLWEVLFKPVLSPRLLDWVRQFRPEIIYCQGYTLSFSWLPVQLRRKLGVPICFQTGDDWPTYLYRDSCLAFAMRPFVERAARQLAAYSSLNFATGDSMAAEYRARYGTLFEPLMICDNIDRFRAAMPWRAVEPGRISIVYTGGLGHGRWKSLLDLCAAAVVVRDYGFDVTVTAFASSVPKEAANILHDTPNLQIAPPPSHEQVPAVLKGADILFLPESFDPAKATAIRLSISTKAHLYMMSERPVLLYASPITGVADYAKREGWAYVVDRKDVNLLAYGLRELLSDSSLSQRFVQRGIEVALKNHSERAVRGRLLHRMQSLAAKAL